MNSIKTWVFFILIVRCNYLSSSSSPVFGVYSVRIPISTNLFFLIIKSCISFVLYLYYFLSFLVSVVTRKFDNIPMEFLRFNLFYIF